MTAAVASVSSPPAHSRPFRARRFANWFPLGLTYATLYMGRYNFGVSTGTITKLGFTNAQVGLIATVGFWTYALSVLVNGPLADKIGGRRAILIGVFGSCALNLLIGVCFKTNLWDTKLILGLSLLYGVNMYFQSFGALSVVKVNASWFHVRERGVLGGVFGSMISLGYFLAYGLCGYLVSRLPLWTVFVIPSGVMLVMGLVDFFVVRDRPSAAGYPDFPTGDEPHVEPLPPAGAYRTASAPEKEAPFFSVVSHVFSQPVLLLLAVAEFCTGIVRQGLLLYFPRFLASVHDIKTGTFAFQVASLGITVGGVAGALLCGFLSDKLFQSRRTPVAFIFYVGQIISILILGWTASPGVASVMIGVSAMWIFGVHGMLSGTASMDFGGKRAAATAAGLLDGVQYLGSGLVGVGLGAIIDRFGYGVWTYTLVPFAAIGGVVMLFLWNARPKSDPGGH